MSSLEPHLKYARKWLTTGAMATSSKSVCSTPALVPILWAVAYACLNVEKNVENWYATGVLVVVEHGEERIG
ncbi:hypothetical protein SERLA73DRAFT_177380, partial [Serpula lacrymans var. lacrymans S7.3]